MRWVTTSMPRLILQLFFKQQEFSLSKMTIAYFRQFFHQNSTLSKHYYIFKEITINHYTTSSIIKNRTNDNVNN